MSKKSHKSSSQQPQQQNQQTAQPKNQQPEPARQKRLAASTQQKGATARDSCDLLAGADSSPVITPESKQVHGSEAGQADKLAPKLERNKRAKLQPLVCGAAENNRNSNNRQMADPNGLAGGQKPASCQQQNMSNCINSSKLISGTSNKSATKDINLKDERSSETNICAACAKPIRERYLLMALDKRWHEDCLKCACCDCRLGEVGSTLFTHSDKLLCRRDFLRIFGKKGLCAACHRQIPAYELVMRAQEKAYHMDCFACQRCQYRFCVGDQFHMTQAHKIICLLCHREQLERSQQQQQQPAQQLKRELPAGLRPAQLADQHEQQQLLELLNDTDNKQHEQFELEDQKPRLELAQLESVDGTPRPPEAGLEPPLVACPVQQMRLPSQKEQERACVM